MPYLPVVVVLGSVSVGDVPVGAVEVLVPSSIDTLPRFSPQAATPADAPAPSAAAKAMIPARLSIGVRVA
jgi:hypothetical protein